MLSGRLRARGWRAWASHIATLALLACIALQSLLLPAQRAAGGSHFHVAAHVLGADAGFVDAGGEHDGHHAGERDDHEARGEHADERHDHAHTAQHSHAEERSDIVYVDTDDAEMASPAAHGPKRGVLDHDGLWPSHGLLVAAAPAAIPRPAGSPPSYRSQVPPLLERPPRSHAA